MATVKIVYLLDTNKISTAFIPINNFISKQAHSKHTHCSCDIIQDYLASFYLSICYLYPECYYFLCFVTGNCTK